MRDAAHRRPVTLTAVLLGLAVGLVMGTLGGGGSVLAVPVLVFVLGLDPQEAVTASLVIVGTTAAVAAAGHARGGTRWRAALLLAAAGVPTSVLGAAVGTRLDGDVLLLGFAVLLLLAAVGMLGNADDVGGTPPAAPPRWAPPLAAGAAVGALTGVFGVGGGFLLVPVLVLVLGFAMPAAIGTSLVVIALNAAVALGARAGAVDLDLGVIVPFTAAAVVAALVGTRLSHRLRPDLLSRGFGVLLVVVAVWTGAQGLAGLA